MTSAKIAVPNGILFVTDIQGDESPQPVRGARVLSTPSCIGFACEFDSEGETDVWLGSSGPARRDHFLLFDGQLETPNRAVAVRLVGGAIALSAPVTRTATRVRIWLNRPDQADKVTIGLD